MGFFDKIKQGLKKTSDAVYHSVDSVFAAFVKVDDDLLEELEEALILSDVGASTAAKIVAEVEKRAKLRKTTTADELRDLLREVLTDNMLDNQPLNTDGKPAVILVIGVNGVGKTTSIGKLAARYVNEGKKVMLSAADTFRAAAADQLEIWAKRAGADIVRHGEGADPAAVVFDSISAAKARGSDIIIVDTAGRLHNKANLMNELAKIDRVISRELPDASRETLLVLDATTGQNAVHQAEEFNKAAELTGIILTKLDGDTRGGAALSVRAVTGKPIKFAGTGEKLTDLEAFHPERMASRILGMGDVMTLIEKAQENIDIDPEQAGDLAKRMKNADFTLDDFLSQMQQIKKMGPLSGILKMLPGMSAIGDIDIPDDAMKKPEAIIRSMTLKERKYPEILNASRRRRIAAGSGTTVQDVNQLIRQFEDMKKQMKMVMNQARGKKGRFRFPPMR